MITLKAIGKNVQKYRKMKGLTQAQLAEQINISTIHMSHIETGITSMSLQCLLKVCEVLDITPNHLLLDAVSINKDGSLVSEKLSDLSDDERCFVIHMIDLLNDSKLNR